MGRKEDFDKIMLDYNGEESTSLGNIRVYWIHSRDCRDGYHIPGCDDHFFCVKEKDNHLVLLHYSSPRPWSGLDLKHIIGVEEDPKRAERRLYRHARFCAKNLQKRLSDYSNINIRLIIKAEEPGKFERRVA